MEMHIRKVPDGYRVYMMHMDDEVWYIPERLDTQRNIWRSYDKGAGLKYYRYKTWNGAYNFIMKRVEI